MGLAINHAEIGTDGFFWKFSIPWDEITKIESTRAAQIRFPPAELQLWIYPRNRAPRFVSVPRLTPNEYKDFFEILSWHTHANQIEFIAE